MALNKREFFGISLDCLYLGLMIMSLMLIISYIFLLAINWTWWAWVIVGLMVYWYFDLIILRCRKKK